ncbi:hypothetical protein [Persicobacter sp. CCB-QB2]|uniref:hypothetical protein n=1 Tax=Persicobacter sp. CCB-QB2 TaxID=1561025 RepID=UPI0006A9A55B|nr:hypothetical protein [Persicobacter sp. CCB-QB2]
MIENRNIIEIAPFLADDFVDLDEPIFDLTQYSKFLDENSDQLGNLKKYLNGKLHDSWITNFELDEKKIQITLNDFSTHVFSDAMVERFDIKIDHDKLVFPLTLELKENLKVEFFQVEENGDLITIDQFSFSEYLGEQVLKLKHDQVKIAFELWHDNPNEDLPGDRILVLVSAKELELIENQDKAWNEIFGKKYDNFYQYFKEQFESDRYVSDYSECLKLVDEYKLKRKKPTAQR